MKTLHFILLVLVVTSSDVFAGDRSTRFSGFDFRKKAESKEKSRWTLQEWMQQKERNRLMDLWLAMYSPSPYEFFISGSYNSFKSGPAEMGSDSAASVITSSGSVGAYATVIGLEGFFENNSAEGYSDSGGTLNLRIAGNAVQATRLIFLYGLRTRQQEATQTQSATRFNQQFAGGDLNLYLNRHFGLQGHYRNYLPSTETPIGTVTGHRTEAGAFIDFGSLRVFGNWFMETQKTENTAESTEIKREGIQSGIRFFF